MWRWKRTRTHINGSTHWILTQNGDSKSKNCEKKNQNYGKYVLSFYLNVMCTNFGFQLLFLSLFTSRFSFFFYMPLSFAFAYLSIRITFSCPSLSLPLSPSFSLSPFLSRRLQSPFRPLPASPLTIHWTVSLTLFLHLLLSDLLPVSFLLLHVFRFSMHLPLMASIIIISFVPSRSLLVTPCKCIVAYLPL